MLTQSTMHNSDSETAAGGSDSGTEYWQRLPGTTKLERHTLAASRSSRAVTGPSSRRALLPQAARPPPPKHPAGWPGGSDEPLTAQQDCLDKTYNLQHEGIS